MALIALSVDGREVERPVREDGELTLGEAARAEADSLELEAMRLLVDGIPARLLSHLRLSVAGRAREVRLGPVLPEGYAPMAILGELPARLDGDGRLRVQLRPGAWTLTVVARAGAPLQGFALPAAEAPWPAEEVLQFLPDPRFRLAQLAGLPALDPDLVRLPDWEDLGAEGPPGWDLAIPPAAEPQTLRIVPGERAMVEVRQRGLPAQQPPRLALWRELWLDFDGGGYSVVDRVRGHAGSLRRLDMAAPWRPQHVRLGAREQLVTAAPDGAGAGVELRERELDLTAHARLERGALGPGWIAPFGEAAFALHLPPGYRLLAATGAERAPGSWWDAWSLLDIFLASLAALLAWRLGRAPLLVLAAGYALLAWHEPLAPRLFVLAALALALLRSALPAGRWRTLARLVLALGLLAVLVQGLPFAAQQLKLALYPQLEFVRVGDARTPVVADAASTLPQTLAFKVAEAPPPAEPTRVVSEEARLDRVEVGGTRTRAADRFEYPADAIPQTGLAMPDWRWRQHPLTWSGPLQAGDALGLWLSPPWLTSLWRVASVLLLAALLWRLGRGLGGRSNGPAKASALGVPPAAAAALLVLGLVPAVPALAQTRADLPDPALIETLRQRLLERREPCQPDCVGLGPVAVRAADGRVEMDLQVQAQAAGVLRLPRTDAGATLVAVALDGASMPVYRHDGEALLRVPAGVRHARLVYLADGPLGLRFADPPARIEVDAPGYRVNGLDEGRLTGDTLGLVPLAAQAGPAAPASQPLPPFVRVQRTLDLGLEWTVLTTVERLAPVEEGFEVSVALLPGERILDAPPPLENGRARIALAAGEDAVSWRSRLPVAESLALVAADAAEYVETWRLRVAPLLHASHRGLPLSAGTGGEADPEGAWIFLPLPGERVELDLSRPEAVPGPLRAVENLSLHSRPGLRAAEHRLGFDLRATQAGEYRLPLPDGAELLTLSLDGEPLPRLLDGGAVSLPVAVGTRRVELAWRQTGAGPLATPGLALGVSAANLRIALEPPQDRWLLWLAGPGIGPALLVWPQLLLLAGLALVLGRWGGTPLRTWHWLLLGLGFATVSWSAALLTAGWLLALGWRGRRDFAETPAQQVNLLQIGLFALTVAALAALLGAVPAGLLGHPDMGVTGNDSSAARLNWFLDRSAGGELPDARAWTLPLWVYKAALLVWSLWLAQALLGWLRWGWQCYRRGGAWRRVRA